MAQVTGVIKISVNGQVRRSEANAKLNLGGKKRKAAVGYKVYGYTEEVVPAELDFTLFHTSDTDLLTLKDIVGGTATFECDSGPIFPLTNVFITEALTLEGGTGRVAVKAQADPVDTVQ